MVLKRINTVVLVFIIICSTSFYEIFALGPLKKGGELIGIGLMVVLMILHFIYAEDRSIKKNFTWPVLLIFFSAFLSMFMANYSRNQGFAQSLFAQKALYFYLFYFMLHQLKVKPKDLEVIFVVLAILYMILYFIQSVLYPKPFVDAFILEDRGTIRIYMVGGSYMAAAFWLSVQNFLWTNRLKYLLFMLVVISIFVMNGGRQTIAIQVLLVIIFIIIDRKVRSRFFLIILGLIGALAIYFLFQDIFDAIFQQSQKDVTKGDEYIRMKAGRYYLTEFFKPQLSYITGNGAYHTASSYGKEITHNRMVRGFFLGDLGLIGNYVLYGVLFVIGVLTICIRSMRKKIEDQFTYLKYIIGAIVLSLLTGGGFAQADFIVFICCILYMIDVSRSSYKKAQEPIHSPGLELNSDFR